MPKNVAPDKTLEALSVGTFAATFAPDITDSSIVKVTMTGNITSLNAPTGRTFGIFTLVFVQDATGGRTVTWNTTDYPDFSTVGWSPNLAASSVSSISFLYDSNSSKWRPFTSWNGDVWTAVNSTSATNVVRVGDQTLSRTASGTISASSTLRAGTLQAATTVEGPTIRGGSASGGNLVLQSTSSGTKGKIFLGTGGVLSAFDEVNNRLGVGNVSPTVPLDVTGAGVFSSTVTAADPTASTHLATKNYVDLRQFGSIATGTVAVGTSLTAITGLSIASVPAGTWSIYAWIPTVVATLALTSLNLQVSPTSGPTTSTLYLNSVATRSGSAPTSGQATAFATNMSTGATAVATHIIEVQGSMVSTGSGTISISMIRAGGGTATTQAGAYLRLERLA